MSLTNLPPHRSSGPKSGLIPPRARLSLRHLFIPIPKLWPLDFLYLSNSINATTVLIIEELCCNIPSHNTQLRADICRRPPCPTLLLIYIKPPDSTALHPSTSSQGLRRLSLRAQETQQHTLNLSRVEVCVCGKHAWLNTLHCYACTQFMWIIVCLKVM